MYYLDENIITTVTGLTASADTVVNYGIYNSEGDILLFAGNMFIKSGTTAVNVEMNDVLESLKPDGSEMALPLTSFDNGLGFFGNFYSKVSGVTSNIISVAMMYRYPNRKNYLETLSDVGSGLTVENCLQGTVDGVPQLLPHFPYIYSSEMIYAHTAQLNSTSMSPMVYYNISADGYLSSAYVTIGGIKPDNTFISTLSNLFTNIVLPPQDLQYVVDEEHGFVPDPDADVPTWYLTETDETFSTIGIYDEDDDPYGLYTLTNTATTYTCQIENPASLCFGVDNNAYFVKCIGYNDNWAGRTLMVSFNAWRININGVWRIYISDPKFHIGDENAEHSYIYINNIKAAEIDVHCMSKYYLMWQDRYGGYQCQAFDKIDTFTEDYSRENITNYRREQRLANATITPKWSIQTGWLNEYYYPFYESIYISPMLLLYDTENNHGYNVNITDTEYTEKTIDNQQKKLFNMKLALQLNKTQIVKY